MFLTKEKTRTEVERISLAELKKWLDLIGKSCDFDCDAIKGNYKIADVIITLTDIDQSVVILKPTKSRTKSCSEVLLKDLEDCHLSNT